MTFDEVLKNYASSFQSIITACSLIVGGCWVYFKYLRRQENYPNIEFTADINLIGKQGEWWIIELIAIIENKGKVQHKMNNFRFDLNAIFTEDQVEVSNEWDGQVDFPQQIAEGSFLPKRYQFFFIDPGVKAKYSYIVRAPVKATFLILHSWFSYADNRGYNHTAERTVSLTEDQKCKPVISPSN